MATIELPANVWTAAAVIAGSADVDHRNSGAAPYRLTVSASSPASASDGDVFASGERGDLTLSDATVWARPINDRTGQITVTSRALGTIDGLANAVGDGVTDDSAALLAAVTASSLVVISKTYLVDGNLTVPATCTLEFRPGGRLIVGEDVTLTINGPVIAGAYQQIFSGDLVQSGFTSDVTPPYTLGVRGGDRVTDCSPAWFGGVPDGTTDSSNAIVCWLYFGKRLYLPPGEWRSQQDQSLKRSDVHIHGDGRASVLKATTGVSAALQLSGVGASVPIQRGLVVQNIHIDAGGVENFNAFGLTDVEECIIDNCWVSNCGQYPVAIQTYGKRNVISNLVIEEASNNDATGAVLSIEATENNEDDVSGNVFTNIVCLNSAVNGVNMRWCGSNRIDGLYVEEITGDPSAGGGVLLRLRDKVTGMDIRDVRCPSVTNRLVALDAASSLNKIHRVTATVEPFAGTANSVALRVDGDFNTLSNFEIVATDPDVLQAVVITGDSNRFDNFTLDASTTGIAVLVSGDSNSFEDARIDGLSSAGPVVSITGDGNRISGGRVGRPSSVTGISLTGPGSEITGVSIPGAGASAIDLGASATRSRVYANRLTGSSPTITGNIAGVAASSIFANEGSSGVNTLRLAGYTLWVDMTGDLRILAGIRATDTDGTVVGTQT